ELVFQRVVGVVSTQAGYTGGKTENPKYADVCSEKTGHAEAVRVKYDPKRVSSVPACRCSCKAMVFQLNRQGSDFGTQYRLNGIYYHDLVQKKQAETVSYMMVCSMG
ncbi:hypothetical protein GUITHDRAFT_63492, partial [Guillardia theta CCMP2712]